MDLRKVTIKPSNITKDDEAAAMAAMFQAQTANWEETQEKMSQLVSRSAILVLRSIYALMNTCFSLSILPAVTERNAYIRIHEAVDLVAAESRSNTTTSIDPFPRVMSATGADRKVCGSQDFTVCNVSYSAQGHWIQDCPTNNDRDYDNRPRIKRTTGIPRSFLKAVENPATGQIGHGVMVTPEGGYVVAQPDV